MMMIMMIMQAMMLVITMVMTMVMMMMAMLQAMIMRNYGDDDADAVDDVDDDDEPSLDIFPNCVRIMPVIASDILYDLAELWQSLFWDIM
jgi:hypothetical protein